MFKTIIQALAITTLAVSATLFTFADQVFVGGVSQSINSPAQVEAIVSAGTSGKVDKVDGTATNLTVIGALTLNGSNVVSGVYVFTNGTIMADGVLNGTNGVFFTPPGSSAKYWIPLPPLPQ
jgi:hypothetical protein